MKINDNSPIYCLCCDKTLQVKIYTFSDTAISDTDPCFIADKFVTFLSIFKFRYDKTMRVKGNHFWNIIIFQFQILRSLLK